MGLFDFFKKKETEEQETEAVEESTAEEEELSEEPQVTESFEEATEEQEELVEEQEPETEETEQIEEALEEETDALEPEEHQEKEEVEEAQGFFARLTQGLKKTRDAISNQFDLIINSFTVINEELLEELEESLIMADVGAVTSLRIVEQLRGDIKATGETDPKNLKGMIRDIVAEMLDGDYDLSLGTKPSVILVIGVNGVGKTTSIGKMAHLYQQEGKEVLLAAADTFRAAAIDQLEVWANRAGVDLVKHQEGADPAAVVYDSIQAGKARNKDLIICDTAGRLHNKKHLMDELAKIRRVIDRELPDADVESLLVLDATTGQNALNQARQFQEVADLTGIILTKLDGTAKGGVVIGIKEELDIPIKFIGVGEQMDDLRPFRPVDFANALFDLEEEA